jgi:cell filamentation protein
MELQVLDPWGDYETAGYLRNRYQERDLSVVGRLETAAFEQEVPQVLRVLRRLPTLTYQHVTDAHEALFTSVYPWAGQDRSVTAPHIAIAKAGYSTLFAHPHYVQRAAQHALNLGQDKTYLRKHPGEVFGYLAHAHPFLEGNGRTILTIYSELSRRAGFHVEWEAINKTQFIETLTRELLKPGKAIMDELVLPYVRLGVLSMDVTASRLRVNFKREQGTSPTDPKADDVGTLEQ